MKIRWAQAFTICLVLVQLQSIAFAAMAGDPESFVDHFPKELTLEQTTELGMKANLDLVAAKYNIDLSKADELTAGLWSNPSILFDTVFQPFGGNWNQTTTGGPRQFDLILSLPLDLSGKRSASVKSAHAATQIAEAQFQDAFRQKVLQIRLSYIDLLVAGYQLSLSKERQDSMARLVKMVENRIGNTGRLPLLQRRARLALDQAVLDSRQRETALRSAKTALAILLNRPPLDTSVEAVSKLRDMKLVPLPDEAELQKDAESMRPDLQALRFTVNKSGFDADLAHAQVWDNFTLTAGVSHQGSADGNQNAASIPGAYSWNAGITIPLPVLNHNQGNIQKAAVTQTQTEKQIQSLILNIHQEIYSDYEQLKLNESLIRDYEDTQLDNARRVRDSQQTLFGSGGSALLDYFDAVSAYQTSLSSYYDVVAEYRRGLARINAAVGKDIL